MRHKSQPDFRFISQCQPLLDDLGAYIAAGAFEYPSAVEETEADSTLQLRMSEGAAGHLHETPLSEDQIISDDPDTPGWVKVTATVQETEQLYWWLLGFGAQLEVLGPARLRERMVANVQSLVGRYGLSRDDKP